MVYDAAFNRAGAVRADDMLDMFYLAETLAKQRRPKGNRLAIISNAGGPAVIAVDQLLKQGGAVAELSQETSDELKRSFHSPSGVSRTHLTSSLMPRRNSIRPLLAAA